MRYALLVAWREYAENAKTKGFWIGIFLLPAILFISFQVPVFLARKGTPTRHFVVADQSGQFDKTIAEAVERRHQRRVLQELNTYAEKHAQPGADDSQFDPLAAFAHVNTETVEQFIRKGGTEFYLGELSLRLNPGAPEFVQPRRQLQRIPLPPGLRPNADLAALVQDLKPYLRGEKRVSVEGREIGLFAAILIPADIEKHIIRPGVAPSSSDQAQTGIEYWSVNLADESLREEVQRAINDEVRRREYLARGMDLALVQQVAATRVPFASLNPKKEEGKERVSGTDVLRQWAPVAFVYLLWIAIFSIMQMLLNNVIDGQTGGHRGRGVDDGRRLGVVVPRPAGVEGRWRAIGNYRPTLHDRPQFQPAACLRDLFPVRLRDVCRPDPGPGERVQHTQGGAELHGGDDDDHGGAAAHDDVHSERPERHAGNGVVLDPALHAVYHDEPRRGGSASV
jgi:hypothetical protein